jgi:hypothetical protein
MCVLKDRRGKKKKGKKETGSFSRPEFSDYHRTEAEQKTRCHANRKIF